MAPPISISTPARSPAIGSTFDSIPAPGELVCGRFVRAGRGADHHLEVDAVRRHELTPLRKHAETLRLLFPFGRPGGGARRCCGDRRWPGHDIHRVPGTGDRAEPVGAD